MCECVWDSLFPSREPNSCSLSVMSECDACRGECVTKVWVERATFGMAEAELSEAASSTAKQEKAKEKPQLER